LSGGLDQINAKILSWEKDLAQMIGCEPARKTQLLTSEGPLAEQPVSLLAELDELDRELQELEELLAKQSPTTL